jgi:hypothetical protein
LKDERKEKLSFLPVVIGPEIISASLLRSITPAPTIPQLAIGPQKSISKYVIRECNDEEQQEQEQE